MGQKIKFQTNNKTEPKGGETQTQSNPFGGGKVARAKCDALDWQAKSELVVTCVSEVIWHIQIQAESECV